MGTLDIIVLVVLGIGFFQGMHNGFAKSLCSFAGFFLGLIVAYMFYSSVGAKLAPHLGGGASMASIVAFILIWLAVPLALNFVGDILTKFLSMIFLGGVNKILGGVLGIIKFFLCTSLVVYVLAMIGLLSSETTDNSFFGSMMVAFVENFMQSFREAASSANC